MQSHIFNTNTKGTELTVYIWEGARIIEVELIILVLVSLGPRTSELSNRRGLTVGTFRGGGRQVQWAWLTIRNYAFSTKLYWALPMGDQLANLEVLFTIPQQLNNLSWKEKKQRFLNSSYPAKKLLVGHLLGYS